MPNKREKLIDLLVDFVEVDVWDNGEFIEKDINFEKIADHLIANGVTIPVRCKDCKYRRGDFFGGFVCRLHKGLAMVTDESFCSYGERRTDE